jgi:4-hydroxymandelate oxidase
VLVDVSRVDASTTLLGSPSSFPLAIAPMAVHGLAHPDGEVATARAAASAGVPFTLSTMSSCSIEDVAAAAPDSTRWFQLYVQGDRGLTRSLVERTAATGYGAILLTVDLPLLGYRERDLRSGFEMPTLGNFGVRPSHRPGLGGADDPVEGELLSRTVTWDDLASIRSWSTLPLVLKGILTAEDALLAVEHGVDAIVVSNHGARQLDRLPAPVEVLVEVVRAVDGRAEVLVDGGVRRGLDIAIALALGAQGVLLGRPILWALAAGGEAGVERALAILRREFEITLGLLGAPTPGHVRPEHLLD